MTKVIFISFTMCCIILSGCNMSNELFEKKQECANYENEIEQEITIQNKWLQESFYELDQIFYSPTQNSCLYSYKWISRQNNFTEKNILDYFIADYLTKDIIFQINNINDYDSKINELKWE